MNEHCLNSLGHLLLVCCFILPAESRTRLPGDDRENGEAGRSGSKGRGAK